MREQILNFESLCALRQATNQYEVLRRRGVALQQQGWKQVAIAQALDLTQGWVCRTLTRFRQQGQEALAWQKQPGA